MNDIPEEAALMGEVEQFIDALKAGLVPDLNQINNANKATVGTFFSVRYPKKAMRSFGVFISKIDWSKSATQIHNQIRALGSGRTKISGTDVKILETRIENDELKILRIQPAGKKPMDWKSFVNGLRGAEIKYGE